MSIYKYNFLPGNSYGLFLIAELVYTHCTENEIDIYLKFGESKIILQFSGKEQAYNN